MVGVRSTTVAQKETVYYRNKKNNNKMLNMK